MIKYNLLFISNNFVILKKTIFTTIYYETHLQSIDRNGMFVYDYKG
jgi:hypothetical protein